MGYLDKIKYHGTDCEFRDNKIYSKLTSSTDAAISQTGKYREVFVKYTNNATATTSAIVVTFTLGNGSTISKTLASGATASGGWSIKFYSIGKTLCSTNFVYSANTIYTYLATMPYNNIVETADGKNYCSKITVSAVSSQGTVDVYAIPY